jgi:3-dehydroquinate dehydratase-2
MERMPKPIYVLNGPNLNLLGSRQPEIYGRETLDDIARRCAAKAQALGHTVEFRQSNHEGVLVDWIQEAGREGSAVILNAGAYTHTSLAIYDVLVSLSIPVIEVHLSNPHAREDFRRHSYVSLAAKGVIMGLGAAGYELSLEAAAGLLSNS